MNEIINSILDAEKEAERIVSDAAERSKASVLRGEEEAERVKERAVEEFGIERKKLLEEAECRAERVYGDILDVGESAAEELKISCKKKIESTADEVVGRVFG